jgi:hypothetical protein
MFMPTDQHINKRKGGGDSETPDAAGARLVGECRPSGTAFFSRHRRKTIGGKI